MLSAAGGRRGIAALEFALVAPVLLSFLFFTLDGMRALLIQRELRDAASEIVVNAGKLSLVTDPTTGKMTSRLSFDQMQQAMSTVFAQIPGLDLGAGDGLFPGRMAVTLSAVSFLPLCAAPDLSGCETQTPTVVWSAYLDPAYVGGSTQLMSNVTRNCAALTPVAAFPDSAAQYADMIAPALASGGTALIAAAPQLVADIQYTFTPWFPVFLKATTYYVSATAPPPFGSLTQTTTVDTSQNTGTVSQCSGS